MVRHGTVHANSKATLTHGIEEETHADIDSAIFDVILNPPDLSGWQSVGIEEHTIHEALGYLLTWMLMFDHFTDIVSRQSIMPHLALRYSLFSPADIQTEARIHCPTQGPRSCVSLDAHLV